MSAEPALKLVETEPVEEKALSIVDQAKSVKVSDATTYTAAGELWKDIGAMIEEVEDTFKPICESAHKAWKTAVAKRDGHLNPLKDAKAYVKRLMAEYDAEQERLRKAEEARLAEIARKQAEEQALLDAIAAEEEMKRNGATQEEAAEVAQSIIDEPVYVAPTTLPKATPRISGGPTFQTRYDFEIVDMSKIPALYMIPDLVKIRQVVTALKEQANIPGIRVFSKRV